MDADARIIDCFPFFNELDLLELRLRTLEDVVDQFVIVEARETFQGNRKPCFFEENATRFAPYSHKIRHLIIESFSETSVSWDREAEQRDYMNATIAAYYANDIILLSDVDELPRPECVRQLREFPPRPNEVVCFSLRHYAHFINLLYHKPWQRVGPRAVLKRSFTGMQNLRSVRGPVKPRSRDLVRFLRACIHMKRLVSRRLIVDAGWHFTWLGGEQAAVTKVMAISIHSGMKRSGKDLRADTVNARRNAITNYQAFSIAPIDDSFPLHIRSNCEAWQSYILTEDRRAPDGAGPQGDMQETD